MDTAVNEVKYNTKYGKVGVSIAPTKGGEIADAGKMNHLITLKISSDKKASLPKVISVEKSENDTIGNVVLKSDGNVDPLLSNLGSSTVEIDDNPANTYGLASKAYLYRTVLNHSEDQDAHSGIFSKIIKTFTDLYEKMGEFRVQQMTDVYDNRIYATGKCITRGDESNPMYIVKSSRQGQSYDNLEQRVKVLEDAISNSYYFEPINTHWVWTSSDSKCPRDFLIMANSFGAPKPVFQRDSSGRGRWGNVIIRNSDGTVKYQCSSTETGNENDLIISFSFYNPNSPLNTFDVVANRVSATNTGVIPVNFFHNV